MPANDREPNGRSSRRAASKNERAEQLEHQTVNVAVSRRVRHLGIVSDNARDPRWGYLLGRLCLDKAVTEQQHEAGLRYAADMARYYGLTGVPFPSARAQDLFAIRSDGDEPQGKGRAAQSARKRMVELRDVLLATGDIATGRRVLTIVDLVCVHNPENLRTLDQANGLWLRQGLNRLARFYHV